MHNLKERDLRVSIPYRPFITSTDRTPKSAKQNLQKFQFLIGLSLLQHKGEGVLHDDQSEFQFLIGLSLLQPESQRDVDYTNDKKVSIPYRPFITSTMIRAGYTCGKANKFQFLIGLSLLQQNAATLDLLNVNVTEFQFLIGLSLLQP